jgi:CDP-6-deoxy-D-xylo-4-hexulose-3-dehydrase
MGYNLKITDMQAACGFAQLEKLDYFISQRRLNFEFLKKRLLGCNEYIDFVEATPNSKPSWFGFLMTLKESSPVSRAELIQYLDQKKIGSRLLFAGNVTRQPYMLNKKFKIFNGLKNTDYIMNNSFWVGIQPNLTFEMLEYTATHIESYLGVRFK